MIANITSGNSFSGLIFYNEDKISKGQGEKLHSNLMLSDTKKGLISTLEKTAATYQGKISKPTFHASISLAHTDKDKPVSFQKLADDYMKEMGYSNSPYVVYRHFDKEHDHIHIVSSRIDINANKVSDSNERFRSQKITRELEKKYDLTIVSSIKSETSEPYLSDSSKISSNPAVVKAQLKSVIKFVLEQVRPVSFEQFERELSQRNVVVEKHEARADGVKLLHPGLIYSLGQNEKRFTKGIRGSAFADRFTFKNVSEILENNLAAQLTSRRKPEQIKELFAALISTLVPNANMPVANFEEQLSRIQFSASYVRNSGGVYGLRLIDTLTGANYKATDIHKKLSWNNVAAALNKDDLQALNNGKTPVTSIVEVTENTVPVIENLHEQYRVAAFKALQDLSKLGLYTKLEFEQRMKGAGLLPVYSTNSSGIYGLRFEEISTGNSFKASDLGKAYSWNTISKRILDTTDHTSFKNYSNYVFGEWKEISEGKARTQNEFVSHLNRYGLTIQKDESGYKLARLIPVDKGYQVGENIKLNKLFDADIYSYFNLKKDSLSGVTLADFQKNGYVATPINDRDRKVIKGWSIGDRDTVIEAYRNRFNITLSEGERKNPALLSSEKTYNLARAVGNYAFQMNKKADDYTKPFNLVRYLNRRGIGVIPLRDKTGKISDLKLSESKDVFIKQSELINKFDDFKKDLLVRFNSKSDETINLNDHLADNDGFLFATDQQITAFYHAMDNQDHQAFKILAQENLDYKNIATWDDPEKDNIIRFIGGSGSVIPHPEENDYEPLSSLFHDENPMNREPETRKKRKRPRF